MSFANNKNLSATSVTCKTDSDKNTNPTSLSSNSFFAKNDTTIAQTHEFLPDEYLFTVNINRKIKEKVSDGRIELLGTEAGDLLEVYYSKDTREGNMSCINTRTLVKGELHSLYLDIDEHSVNLYLESVDTLLDKPVILERMIDSPKYSIIDLLNARKILPRLLTHYIEQEFSNKLNKFVAEENQTTPLDSLLRTDNTVTVMLIKKCST